MAGAWDIAARTRKIDVDNRLPVLFYYRTADKLLRQASIYRDEHNVIDLYILLVQFSSLVAETIPDHRDYRTASLRERAEYKKKLIEVLNEIEALKLEVRRQIERVNQARRLQWTENVYEWADFTAQWPTGPKTIEIIEEEMNKELSRIGSLNHYEAHPGAANAAVDYDRGTQARRSPPLTASVDERADVIAQWPTAPKEVVTIEQEGGWEIRIRSFVCCGGCVCCVFVGNE